MRGEHLEDVAYTGAAAALQHVWIAVRVNLRGVCYRVAVADLASGQLPEDITELGARTEAWVTR